jgi:hypothetical protein
MDHQTCQLGWFLPVIDLWGPGISMCELHGGVFYEHCALSSFTIYTPVAHHTSSVTHLSCGGQTNVTMQVTLGSELKEIFELTLHWRIWYHLNTSMPRPSVSYAKPNTYHGRPFSLASPDPHFQMLYGTNYNVCQENAIGPSYQAFLLVVLSLCPKQTLHNTIPSSFSLVCSSDNYDPCSRAINNSSETLPLNFTPHVTEAYNTTFTMDELLAALERCCNLYLGPDGIRNEMLSPFCPQARSFFCPCNIEYGQRA